MTVELRLFEERYISFRVSSMFVCKYQRKHLRGLLVYLKNKDYQRAQLLFIQLRSFSVCVFLSRLYRATADKYPSIFSEGSIISLISPMSRF